MSVQHNPFSYGRPVETRRDLVDRERELAELSGHVERGEAVMLYAPRRYGKTSVARVVAEGLVERSGTPAIFVDLWGVTSLSDVSDVLGRSYAAASGAEKMRRYLSDLLRSIGFTVGLGGMVTLNRAARERADEERAALRELLEVPRRMASRSPSGRLLMVLDEFGEVFNVPGDPDAMMRAAFQAAPEVSFLFMGSKRSLMNALFTERNRPFYNFGRRMELGRLSYEDLGDFVERKFREAGHAITPAAVDVLLALADGHPYRAQQLAFHTFRELSRFEQADEERVIGAKEAALDETGPEFRAILDGMGRARRALYVAICREPPKELYSRAYMRRHGIRGSGSLDRALEGLLDSGDIELASGTPVPTDPLLAQWVRERLHSGPAGREGPQ